MKEYTCKCFVNGKVLSIQMCMMIHMVVAQAKQIQKFARQSYFETYGKDQNLSFSLLM